MLPMFSLNSHRTISLCPFWENINPFPLIGHTTVTSTFYNGLTPRAICSFYSRNFAVQRETAVAAYLKSEQLLLFAFKNHKQAFALRLDLRCTNSQQTRSIETKLA